MPAKAASHSPERSSKKRKPHPFRRAVLGGMAIALPPLLTIVIFLWVWGTVDSYILTPIETVTRNSIVYWGYSGKTESYDLKQGEILPEQTRFKEVNYRHVGDDNQYIPKAIYDKVKASLDGEAMPNSPRQIYSQYVRLTHLRRQYVIPLFLCVFILLMYALGKFMAAGAGRFFVGLIERVINALPLIRNVYSSVKQVTDFMLTERDLEYTRVVAIEYPRKGIWSIGFVTGEGMIEIKLAANESVLSVLVPTSPMPVTGYTVVMKRSEVLDLDLTIDQALQYIVSCGVVVSPHQIPSQENFDRIRQASADPKHPVDQQKSLAGPDA